MIAAVITIAYIALMPVFGCLFYVMVHNNTQDMFDREMNSPLAGFIGGMVWPVGLVLVACFPFVQRCLRDPNDGLSRRQHQQLAYEQKRLDLAKKANETQREWLRLIEKDGVR